MFSKESLHTLNIPRTFRITYSHNFYIPDQVRDIQPEIAEAMIERFSKDIPLPGQSGNQVKIPAGYYLYGIQKIDDLVEFDVYSNIAKRRKVTFFRKPLKVIISAYDLLQLIRENALEPVELPGEDKRIICQFALHEKSSQHF